MQLTEHFSLEELVRSDYATRHGINNNPTDHEVLSNLQTLADGLERLRILIECPIHINSGYRSPKVNAGVGGSKISEHMKGLAADIVTQKYSPQELCNIIEDNKDFILFDTLIYEGNWTHIAFSETGEPRFRIFTAIFKPGKTTEYVKGIV